MLVIGAGRRQIQLHRTGDSGNRRTWHPDGSLEWWALAVADLGYLTVGLGAPLTDLAGLTPVTVLNEPVVAGLGLAVAVLGIMATLAAQLSLGASWRIGIDDAEHTDLITHGAFQVVRNPIFAAVIATFLGMALMVPNLVGLAGVVVAVIGIEAQVRFAEEPHLRKIHGAAYTGYASHVGRFLPGIGRLQPEYQKRA
ncbi:protein-S-isoprenylcysteine methyltransferase [Mycolicibacterium grossiae]|uniref:Protein-S-isoprenylcysteine methyltransferase n=2 Tax=Mycolicibacterium grossiae TaxID=1552759 RepID=A0A1E8PVK6_9MYCO|nr:protein-S-isoprenylcysteine methyltransferase [Mycolicibacterium grossiae]